MRAMAVIAASLLLGGCIGQGQWGESPGTFPNGARLSQIALQTVKAKETWVPLVAAGLLVATDVDHQWSEDLYEDQPLFGGDGEDLSSDMRDVASGAYLLTALLAPSPTLNAKVRGLAVGAGTAVLDGAVNEGLKSAFRRERPDGTSDNSMPSGHASKTASRSTLARHNLRYIDMPQWSRQVAQWSLHGISMGTALARVEAGKHHLSDVLVGYALGNYIANFMQAAFLEERSSGVYVSFAPVQQGGVLTLTLPVR